MEAFYVKDPESGKYYLEVPGTDGKYEYQEAEAGLTFKALPDGKFIAVRDRVEYGRQREIVSHNTHFGSHVEWDEKKQRDVMVVDDERVARQRIKRLNVLAKQLASVVSPENRVDPTGAFERITDEKYFELHEKAVAAQKAGVPFPDFIPLNTYIHKLTTKSGAVVRPVFKGEVGMRGATILVLQTGYGVGDRGQVPATLVGMDYGTSGSEGTIVVAQDVNGTVKQNYFKAEEYIPKNQRK